MSGASDLSSRRDELFDRADRAIAESRRLKEVTDIRLQEAHDTLGRMNRTMSGLIEAEVKAHRAAMAEHRKGLDD
ncbi:hypothetical protein [Enterovirga aerilata]|uniref:Uncharacterized protein n=1 Tax=Enterovirga aerilata TaxID=2730920 RepID=A0A849I729_9HYPH|nr:hypothetical protein [Enterovirga sp. DB1703]NNM72115.1 hypothetical protein [Enterovirga sp. DB1703]